MSETKMREMTYAEAICEALHEEMTRDENVIVMGEDVGVHGGNFRCTLGLRDKFGDLRAKDTPISESGFVGLGVGSAMVGLRPVIELMFSDFTTVAMDQIVNQAAKMHYMSGGLLQVPLTIRTTYGGGRSSAAQHSQSLQAWFAHVPGLKIVMPSDAAEAKGLLKTAIRDNNPVLFFEHKMKYNKPFLVPEGEYTIPFGKANIVVAGNDLTIAATGGMVLDAVEAATTLKKDGISVEVIDIRTVVPFDIETIITSVQKTGRLLVADEGHIRCGVGAEIAMTVQEKAFFSLEGPIMRIGTPDVVIPFSPALEFPLIPNAKTICTVVKSMV